MVFFLPIFSRSQNVTVSLHILLILDHWKHNHEFYLDQFTGDYECWTSWKARLWMLNWLKSEIMSVETVQVQMMFWKTVLCLFVNMKWIQNEKSQFSTDLNCNLKKKRFYFSQESPALYRIVSFHYQIVSYWFLVLILLSCPCLVQASLKLT
jgi:hypothetical protein